MGHAQCYALPASLAAFVLLAQASMGSDATHPAEHPVRLLPGALTYQTTSSIQVTITNQSTQTISFTDHRTNCTVLQLERRVARSWKPIAPCERMIATRLHTLEAGQKMEVALTAPGRWPEGIYRARLDYLIGSAGDSGTEKTIVSREFRIN